MSIFGGFARIFRRLRRRCYGYLVRRTAEACGPYLRINGRSRINRRTRLGRNVNFNGLEIAGNGPVTIGDNFHSGPDCLLITQIHNFDDGKAIPYDETVITREIVIEDNVWLGSRVIILGGVRIGEGAIIQAGSCVVGDIPAGAIAGGHPAKVFKNRNMQHYEALKAKGKFH